MVHVIPAILTNSVDELKELVSQAQGVVNRIQIDIIDGEFAENKTIDPSALNGIETSLLLDFHLMVKEPINWVEKCFRAGADRVIGQIEMMENQNQFMQKVQALGTKAGLAIDRQTPVEKILPETMPDLDLVLVMSVSAGFGGQKFDPTVLDKIKRLYDLRDEYRANYVICDDGGITLDNIDDERVAGVDEVVVGKRIFEGDMGENIRKFLKAAYKQ